MKSHTGFRLVTKSTTLSERRNDRRRAHSLR